MSGMEPLVLLQLGATAAGTGVSLFGQSKARSAQADIAEHDAAALETQAGQQRAVAQRKAELERVKADRLLGEQRARAAASGGGMDGSVAEILGETARRGEFNSNLRLWEGEEAARGAETQADYKRYASKVGASTAGIETASTILSGVASMAGTMGKAKIGGGPKYAYDMPTDDSWRRGTTVRYS